MGQRTNRTPTGADRTEVHPGEAAGVTARAARARSGARLAALVACVSLMAFAAGAAADTSDERGSTGTSPDEGPAAAMPAETDAETEAGRAQPTLPTIEVLVGGVPLVVEIASGGEERYRGLSFRRSLAEDAGMLFVYPAARPLTFTMRNTMLPLTIAFIGDDLVVQEVIDMDVGPGQLFDSERPARYALEVNQGWFERHDLGPGALVTMP